MNMLNSRRALPDHLLDPLSSLNMKQVVTDPTREENHSTAIMDVICVNDSLNPEIEENLNLLILIHCTTNVEAKPKVRATYYF